MLHPELIPQRFISLELTLNGLFRAPTFTPFGEFSQRPADEHNHDYRVSNAGKPANTEHCRNEEQQ